MNYYRICQRQGEADPTRSPLRASTKNSTGRVNNPATIRKASAPSAVCKSLGGTKKKGRRGSAQKKRRKRNSDVGG